MKNGLRFLIDFWDFPLGFLSSGGRPRYNIEKDIAAFIKKEFDKIFGHNMWSWGIPFKQRSKDLITFQL
jgi:hypothetical protein